MNGTRTTMKHAVAVALIVTASSLSLSTRVEAKAKPKGKGAASAPVDTKDPSLILERAEDLRNPSLTYKTNVTLVDEKKGKKQTQTFETVIKGRDKALVKFLTPEADRGTQVLFVDVDMWIKVKSSAKATRIAPKQKLAGNAAYGDVARLNFIGNYAAKLDREATLDGEAAWVLELKAVPGRPVTYDLVEYWVAKAGFKPLKAEYKTESGKTIRVATFGDYEPVLGVDRPTQMRLVDSLQKSHVTTITFKNATATDAPDLMFQKQNLGRD
jgi:outer membrane lipoprotein-sorting protein